MTCPVAVYVNGELRFNTERRTEISLILYACLSITLSPLEKKLFIRLSCTYGPYFGYKGVYKNIFWWSHQS